MVISGIKSIRWDFDSHPVKMIYHFDLEELQVSFNVVSILILLILLLCKTLKKIFVQDL